MESVYVDLLARASWPLAACWRYSVSQLRRSLVSEPRSLVLLPTSVPVFLLWNDFTTVCPVGKHMVPASRILPVS